MTRAKAACSAVVVSDKLRPVRGKPGRFISLNGAEYEPWRPGDEPKIMIDGKPWHGLTPKPVWGIGPC